MNCADAIALLGREFQSTIYTITFSMNRSGRLTSLFILFTGPQRIPSVEQLITEHDMNHIVHTIIANYDKSNLRFPIQKFFLGKKDMLKKNSGRAVF